MSIEFLRNLAVMLAALAVAGFFTAATYQLQRNGDELAATSAELRRAAQIVADYADAQSRMLGSEKNQKALEAGWQTPAILNGTARTLNTTTLPALNAAVKELRAQTTEVGQAAKGALDNHAALAAIWGEDSRQMLQAGTAAIAEGRLIGEKINHLLDSPELVALFPAVRAALENTNGTLDELRTLSAQLAKAAGRSEAIAKEAEQILVDGQNALRASAAALREGKDTLATVKKATWANVLIALAKLFF